MPSTSIVNTTAPSCPTSVSTVTRFISAHLHGLTLGAILSTALAVRIAALISLMASGYYDTPRVDEAFYYTWALQIASGLYQSSAPYQLSPLPAYVDAGIFMLFGPNIYYIRVLNVLLGVATCYAMYLIGRELGGIRVGLAASLLAALYGPFILYSIVPLKTALSVFLFAMVVYLFISVRPPALMKTVCLGLLLGLLLAVRENAAVLVPVILAILLWSGYRETASRTQVAMTLGCFIMGLAIAVAPFAIRNYRASGELVVTTHAAGFNLYLGNNPDNPAPYYLPAKFANPTPADQGVQFTIEASRRVGRRLSSAEASSFWMQEVLDMAIAHPRWFAQKLWEKTLALLNRFEPGDHYHLGFMGQDVAFFRLPLLKIDLILPLALSAMAMFGFASRQITRAAVCVLAYGLTLIVFYTIDRYRLPMLTVLIPFAVFGLDALRVRLTRTHWKTVFLYAVIASVFTVIEIWPVQGGDDRALYETSRGQTLYRTGRVEEALIHWESSSAQQKPGSAPANLWLAIAYGERSDLAHALFFLDKVPDGSFVAARKYELKGDVLLVQGLLGQAAEAYRRCLTINSGVIRAREKLTRVLASLDPEAAHRETATLRDVLTFYEKASLRKP